MNKKRNIVLGIFVAIGLICVGYMTIKFGRMEVLGHKGTTLMARFTNVSGLRVGANVEISGVRIGRVSSIKLHAEDFTAYVELKLEEGVSISEDAMASIKTSGLIGDKYVCITPGGSEDNLSQGDMITDTEPTIDLEALISKYVFGGV